jgi:adenine phosphoribosyltransferase
MQIALASTSSLKLRAVSDAFPAAEIYAFPADSRVSNQPRSRAETLNGAQNRLNSVKSEQSSGIDLWVSIENGVFEYIHGSRVFVDQACVLIEFKSGKRLELWSEAVNVPQEIVAEADNRGITIGQVLVEMKEIEDASDPHVWLGKNPAKSRRNILANVMKFRQSDRVEIVRQKLQVYENFPRPNITFYDVLPALSDPLSFGFIVQVLIEKFKQMIWPVYDDKEKDLVFIGLESRGFLLAPAIAYELKAALGVIRKQNKLPGKKRTVTYKKEYGEDIFEISEDTIHANSQVVLVDDLVATGGSLKAARQLVEECGGKVVGILAIVDLFDLHEPFSIPLCSIFKF